MTKFEDEIQSKGYIAYTNEGDSMMPLLRQHRDVMVIRKLTEPPKKNDAVLFKRPNGAYVLHRIIRVCGNGQYRIAGDNRAFSELVPGEWIIGILTEVIKDSRHIYADSEEYKTYVKKVPLHRFSLKVQSVPQRIKRKLRKAFAGRD